jgi:hypothetical protein
VQAQATHAVAQPPLLEQPRPLSGFHGVYASRERRQARIYCDGKRYDLGTFDTKQEEAAPAYDRAARQCGEGKPLNHQAAEAAEEAATQTKERLFIGYVVQRAERARRGRNSPQCPQSL